MTSMTHGELAAAFQPRGGAAVEADRGHAARPGARQEQLLARRFAARHRDASDRQLVAGAAALRTHLAAGSLLSDALIAAERAVAETSPARGLSRPVRRIARGRRPLALVPTWACIRLAEIRVALATRARRARAVPPPVDDFRADAGEVVQPLEVAA